MTISHEQIATNVQDVFARIQSAARKAGRDPKEIELLAISKKIEPDLMWAAAEAGVTSFGENYVQEAVNKIEQLPPTVSFHLTGPLQRNKAKYVVGRFSLIHSVDRLELAQALSRLATSLGVVQRCLVQINISKEESKSGADPESAKELLALINQLPGLNCVGLMCIGQRPGISVDERREEFRQLRQLRDKLSRELDLELPELSMGMSDDFEVAIEEGATIVRVGTAIFGERK